LPTAIDFAPFWIEATANGATFVVGAAENGDSRTLRMDSIVRVQLLDHESTPPTEIDHQLLASPAGVLQDTSPHAINVSMLFAADVAHLLLSYRWHGGQGIEKLDNGQVRLSLSVKNWQDLIEWVRAWGADVEVLEPPEFRDYMIEQAQQLCAIYETFAQ
jgi:predicted DNA-binding transcriptional regulator YafY